MNRRPLALATPVATHPRRLWRSLAQAGLALSLAGTALPSLSQSLGTLYNAAREFDATYLSARSQYEANLARAEQARAGLRPQAALSAGANVANIDNSLTGNRDTNSQNAAMSASLPLYRPANQIAFDQAQKSLEVAEGQLLAAEHDLIVRSSQAYFDVLAAQDTLTFVKAQKTAVAEQLAAAKRNFEVGNVTVTDVREAQARSDAATAQEIAANNDLQTKRAALDVLVGRTGVDPKPLQGGAVLPTLLPTGVNDWVTMADNSPNIRKAQLGLEIARDETRKARAGHLPTVELVGTVARTHNSETTSSSGNRGNVDSASLGVEAKMSLFAGFSTQNRIKETLALEEKSERDVDAARRGVQLGTRQAYLGVQSGLALVKANEAAEASYKLAVEATQLGYRVGVRVNIDVLNAQRDLYNSQRDLAKSRHDVLVAGLKLRQAAGTLVASDLEPVDRLLAK